MDRDNALYMSSTSPAICKTEMGLYPGSMVRSFPLGIGTILAVFHSVGNTPVEIDKVVNEEVIPVAVDLSIFAVIKSHPVVWTYQHLLEE